MNWKKIVEVPKGIRIHWTGCPNSCGQVQAADIGLMGGPAKKMNAEGVLKAVPGVIVFIGGTIGEHGKLQLEPTSMNGGAGTTGVPIDDLVPVLTQLIIDRFHGKINPRFEEEQTVWQKAREKADAVLQAAAEAKAAKKMAAKAESNTAATPAPKTEVPVAAASQAPPPAKLELPKAKLETAAVIDKQRLDPVPADHSAVEAQEAMNAITSLFTCKLDALASAASSKLGARIRFH